LNNKVVALLAAGQGKVLEHPRADLCASQRATLVGGSSVTDQCRAATALLTREYQIDSPSPIPEPDREPRHHLGSIRCALKQLPLDNHFHIRSVGLPRRPFRLTAVRGRVR
jgi:hypothetical protein